jgi:hypothetical protein
MYIHQEAKNEGDDDADIAMLVDIPEHDANNEPVWHPAIVTNWQKI